MYKHNVKPFTRGVKAKKPIELFRTAEDISNAEYENPVFEKMKVSKKMNP